MYYHDRENKKETPPAGITREDIEEGRVIRLHVPKFSAGPRNLVPFWIVRDKDDPWRFHDYEGVDVAEKTARRAEQAKAETRVNMDEVKKYLLEKLRDGKRYSKNAVQEAYEDIGIGRNDVRRAIVLGIAEKHFEERELPKKEQRGALKTYIVPVGAEDETTDEPQAGA